jgi:hypothetical protein
MITQASLPPSPAIIAGLGMTAERAVVIYGKDG